MCGNKVTVSNFQRGFWKCRAMLLSVMKSDGRWRLRMKGEMSCNVWDIPWNEELSHQWLDWNVMLGMHVGKKNKPVYRDLSWEFNSALHKSTMYFSEDFHVCWIFQECHWCINWGKIWPCKVPNFNKNWHNLENITKTTLRMEFESSIQHICISLHLYLLQSWRLCIDGSI